MIQKTATSCRPIESLRESFPTPGRININTTSSLHLEDILPHSHLSHLQEFSLPLPQAPCRTPLLQHQSICLIFFPHQLKPALSTLPTLLESSPPLHQGLELG